MWRKSNVDPPDSDDLSKDLFLDLFAGILRGEIGDYLGSKLFIDIIQRLL